MNNFVKNYYPKRPVKSFQDLEVYQKLLAVSVAVSKRINPVVIARNEMTKQSSTSSSVIPSPAESGINSVEGSSTSTQIAAPRQGGARNDIVKKLVETVLDLPVKIAAAHSLRFADQTKAVQTLEEVMLDCNLLIVYLEQYRDIENSDIETEFFEEQIRTLLTTRYKVMHLQMSWKKFNKEKEEEK